MPKSLGLGSDIAPPRHSYDDWQCEYQPRSNRAISSAWQKWQELGLMDELVLQVYRDRLDSFEIELSKPEVQAVRAKIPTSIGILAGLKTRPIASPIINWSLD